MTTSIREIGAIIYLDNKMSFQQFDERMQSQAHKPAIKWVNLPINDIYRIDQIKTITTRFGEGKILELTTRYDKKLTVWAPARLAKDLGWDDLPRFIRPLGKFPCKSDSTKTYHKYDLLPTL